MPGRLPSHVSSALHTESMSHGCQGGRREEKGQCWRTRDRGMSEESEGAIDLFHSCKRCACNVNSLHPSPFFAKTEAVWREGRLCLNSDAATFILLHRTWAQQIQGASNSKTQINEGFHRKTKRRPESNVHLHFPNKENTDPKHSQKEALNDQGEKCPQQLACIVRRTNENKHYSKTFFFVIYEEWLPARSTFRQTHSWLNYKRTPENAP